MLFRTTAALLALALPLAADEPQKRYSERVEVQVRSAVVVLTDAKGKPLAWSPSLADFEVREDGQKVTLVGLDPVALDEPPVSPLPAAPASSPAAPVSLAPRPRAKAVRQVLYVDTTCLRQASLPQVTSAITRDLPRLLAMGPLEIVVADPRPRTVLAATSDVASLTAELKRLASDLAGRDRIAKLRRQLVTDEESLAFDSVSLHSIDNSWAGDLNRAATAREEMAIVVSSLSHLVSWGTAERPEGSGVLYLASDGFDTDLSAFYGGGGSLGGLVAGAGASLSGAGWVVMPVALGAPGGALVSLTADQNGFGRDSHPVFISSHRLDSLQHVAEETGGQVVSYAGELTPALDGLATRWTLAWRATRPPDGKLHELEVKSLRKEMVVHAARWVASGSATSLSTARALAELRGDAVERDLPVEARVTDAVLRKGLVHGTLIVRAKLVAIRDLLPLLGTGRMRVTLAVGIPGSTPFVHHEERELKSLGNAVGWELHLPIEWPEKAVRASVVVEELGTGAWGATKITLASSASGK